MRIFTRSIGIIWVGEGTLQRYYVFCALPFVLATACFVFTKLLRLLVKHWRSHGLRIIVYLDDSICAAKRKSNTERDSLRIQNDLCEADFVTNLTKCKWLPSQQCTFNIDLHQGVVSMLQEKLSALHAQLAQALKETKLSTKFLAIITGEIISMLVALGPVARLMTRGLRPLRLLMMQSQIFIFGSWRFKYLMPKIYMGGALSPKGDLYQCKQHKLCRLHCVTQLSYSSWVVAPRKGR